MGNVGGVTEETILLVITQVSSGFKNCICSDSANTGYLHAKIATCVAWPLLNIQL